jgi:hypothetical protein
MNIAEKILACPLKTATMEVPEWDVTVGIREITAAERVKFGEDAKKTPALAVVRLVIATLTDPETGGKVFEPAHQDVLLQRSGSVMDRVVTEILKLSAMTEEKAEEVEKN